MTDLVLSSGASITAPPVVRVAGLPSEALRRLRFERSIARIEELVQRRERSGRAAEALSEELYTVIGDLSDEGVKPALIGLRRTVYQGRRPRGSELSDAVLAALPAAVRRRLDAWLGDLADLERCAGELPEILAAETTVKEAVLRDVAGSAGFRRALSQAGPSLYAELAKWLDKETNTPRRQTMVRLAKYISRASAKTSPYSTFTISGCGIWCDEGPVATRRIPWPPVSGVLEIQGMLMRSLLQELCAHSGLTGSLPLTLNPSITAMDGKLSFVGHPPDESIVTVPAAPAITECVRILTENPDLTRDDLRARLGSDDAGAVDRFLDRLVDMGLLIRRLPVADQAADPLGELAAWLAASGDHPAREIVPMLDRLRAELHRDVPVDQVAAHVVRQHRLEAAVGELVQRLGMPSAPVAAMGKTLFHENAVFTGPVAECSVAHWRPAIDDLDAIRHWLAPFSPSLPLKLTLGTYCAERFGSGARIPLLTLYRAVQEEIVRGNGHDRSDAAREMARFLLEAPLAAGPALTASPLPRLRRLAELQEEARQAVVAPADPDGVVRVAAAGLASLAAGWPAWIDPPESLGCYVQPIDHDGALSIVLNVAHAGYGRGRSRLEHLIERAGGRPPRIPAWREVPTGRILAEFSGTFASALNVRAAGVPYELDYPFTHSDRPAAARVAPGDLAAVHDPETGLLRLMSVRTGTEVTPLHLGMMADILLPPLARLIAWAFGPTYYLHSSMSPLVNATTFRIPDEVVAYPRVVAGRVVLRRRRWVAPTVQVPVRAKAENDSGYLLRMVEWLRSNGIPQRCYIRIWSGELWGEEGPDLRSGRWVLEKSRKPVFVDFANWFLVQAFARMLTGAGPAVVFEEALPDPTGPTDTGPGSGPDGVVSEFLIEISDKKVSV